MYIPRFIVLYWVVEKWISQLLEDASGGKRQPIHLHALYFILYHQNTRTPVICMQLQPHPFMFRAVPHFSPFCEIAIVQAQGSVVAIYGLKCGTARNMKGWGCNCRRMTGVRAFCKVCCIHYGGTNHRAIPSLHNITDQKYPCTCITCERRTVNHVSAGRMPFPLLSALVVSFMLYVCALRRSFSSLPYALNLPPLF